MTDWRSLKRRQYSEAFKRQVVAEAAEPGISVASVARRHGLNSNLIFNWRRLFGADQGPAFVPAVVVADALPSDGHRIDPCSPGGRMEVICPSGRRIVLNLDFDSAALGRLLAVVDGR
jgi:transposase